MATNGHVSRRQVVERPEAGGGGTQYYFQMYGWREGAWRSVSPDLVPLGDCPKVAEYMLWNSGLNAWFHGCGHMRSEVQHAEAFIQLGLKPRKYEDHRLDAHRRVLDELLEPLSVRLHHCYVRALEQVSEHIESAAQLRGYMQAMREIPRLPEPALKFLLQFGVPLAADHCCCARGLNLLLTKLADRARDKTLAHRGDAEIYFLRLSKAEMWDVAREVAHAAGRGDGIAREHARRR